jgi:hypothetical protein
MHGGRLTARAALGVCIMGSCACISLIGSKNTYAVTSPSVRVNGADIRMQVKPEGSEGGSYAFSAMVVAAEVATFDGPFRWRLEALGKNGEQECFVVHRIHTKTGKTQRNGWYPSKELGKRADFKAIKDGDGTSRAVYPIPGLLVVKPREDGDLEVTVDLTVTTKGKGERKIVRFRMDPMKKRQDEFIFLPTEIVNHIGKSPSEWDEPGWD